MGQIHSIGRVATSVATDEGWTRVTYHSTVVVKFRPGTVVLNSGGWRTKTTQTRMNQASNQFGLGYQIFQKDFAWYVRKRDGSVVEFSDNMTIAT